MAGLKAIKRRLTSVKNTRKITYAMKLVAAAKLRKVQGEVHGLQLYKSSLLRACSLVLPSLVESGLSGPLTQNRPVRSVRLIIVGGFRGLAGGYNSNLNKFNDRILPAIRSQYGDDVTLLITVVGKKPLEHFRRIGVPVSVAHDSLPESVVNWPIESMLNEAIREFEAGEVDRTLLVFTEFFNAMNQMPRCESFLPILETSSDSAQATETAVSPKNGALDRLVQAGIGLGDSITSSKVESLCEPSPSAVLSAILPRLLRAQLLNAAYNSQASEHANRMTAMEAATKNANELADSLRLTYNKVRQSTITAELLDIIGGAEAVV